LAVIAVPPEERGEPRAHPNMAEKGVMRIRERGPWASPQRMGTVGVMVMRLAMRKSWMTLKPWRDTAIGMTLRQRAEAAGSTQRFMFFARTQEGPREGEAVMAAAQRAKTDAMVSMIRVLEAVTALSDMTTERSVTMTSTQVSPLEERRKDRVARVLGAAGTHTSHAASTPALTPVQHRKKGNQSERPP